MALGEKNAGMVSFHSNTRNKSIFCQLSTHTRHIFLRKRPCDHGQASWHELGWDGIRWIRVVGGGGNNYLRPKLVAGLRFCVLVRMWKRKRECEQRLNNCPPTSPIPTTITTITTARANLMFIIPRIIAVKPDLSSPPLTSVASSMLRCRQMGCEKKRWRVKWGTRERLGNVHVQRGTESRAFVLCTSPRKDCLATCSPLQLTSSEGACHCQPAKCYPSFNRLFWPSTNLIRPWLTIILKKI